jgi:hypothetical protein
LLKDRFRERAAVTRALLGSKPNRAPARLTVSAIAAA